MNKKQDLIKLTLLLAVLLLNVTTLAYADSDVRAVLVPPKEAKLSSQMNGKINKFYVKAGASFRRGTPLVGFKCDEQQAKLQMSAAEMLLAEKSFDAKKQLHELQAASDLDVDIAQAEFDKATAENTLANTKVKDCMVKAPFSGRVVTLLANAYENVSYGAPLLEIVQSGTLELDLLVPSSWLSWLKKGNEFEFLVDETGVSHKGKIITIGARVDPVSQTIALKAKIIGDQSSLLAGMSGSAKFGSAAK